MRINNFEKAIAAKDSNIVIDEFKLDGGHVSKCYGHVGNTLILWDYSGQSYSSFLMLPESEIDHDTHTILSDNTYNRNLLYDLKFT